MKLRGARLGFAVAYGQRSHYLGVMRKRGQGTILIVGGSAEARALAARLPQAQVRLAGPERVAQAWPGKVSHGPVTRDWLAGQGVAAVIEAAHPCDAETAWAVSTAARALGLPHLQLVRAPWRAARGDRWVTLRRAQDAAKAIPPGTRVFATTGRDGLADLRGLRATVLARVIDAAPGPLPLPRGRFVPGEGPFTVASEIRLLRRLRIDWLLLRNAGGAGGWPKLGAARALGLPVAMIARPERPDGPRVRDVEGAISWLRRQGLADESGICGRALI